MTIDRPEAQFELKESSQTYSDSLACELFSERSSMSFKSGGAGTREVNELDFSQDIYSSEGKENEASEGARVTQLALAQREQRLAGNQDVQQNAPGDRASVAERKDNETVEAERVTPLAFGQREERLARNLDVQQSGRSERKENEIAERGTPLASTQRAQRLMTDTLNQK